MRSRGVTAGERQVSGTVLATKTAKQRGNQGSFQTLTAGALAASGCQRPLRFAQLRKRFRCRKHQVPLGKKRISNQEPFGCRLCIRFSPKGRLSHHLEAVGMGPADLGVIPVFNPGAKASPTAMPTIAPTPRLSVRPIVRVADYPLGERSRCGKRNHGIAMVNT